MFHGFNPPTARMDGRTMTYRVASPLNRMSNLLNIRHRDQPYIAMAVEEAFEAMKIIEVRKHHL